MNRRVLRQIKDRPAVLAGALSLLLAAAMYITEEVSRIEASSVWGFTGQ